MPEPKQNKTKTEWLCWSSDSDSTVDNYYSRNVAVPDVLLYLQAFNSGVSIHSNPLITRLFAMKHNKLIVLPVILIRGIRPDSWKISNFQGCLTNQPTDQNVIIAKNIKSQLTGQTAGKTNWIMGLSKKIRPTMQMWFGILKLANCFRLALLKNSRLISLLDHHKTVRTAAKPFRDIEWKKLKTRLMFKV